MTTINEMAKEAGIDHYLIVRDFPKQLERFATLVAAHEREALAEQEPVAWMVTTEGLGGTPKTYPITGRYKDVRDVCDFGDPEPLYTAPVSVEAAVLAEREACAKVCEERSHRNDDMGAICAAAIRARGEE